MPVSLTQLRLSGSLIIIVVSLIRVVTGRIVKASRRRIRTDLLEVQAIISVLRGKGAIIVPIVPIKVLLRASTHDRLVLGYMGLLDGGLSEHRVLATGLGHAREGH